MLNPTVKTKSAVVCSLGRPYFLLGPLVCGVGFHSMPFLGLRKPSGGPSQAFGQR